MAKLGVYMLLIVCSVVAAGVYGMVHNQVSYTVGPSYFHDLKFAQFGLPADISPRFGAALLGWQASWWMGLAVGLVPMTFAWLTFANAQSLWFAGKRALIVAICGTLLSSCMGLAFGIFTITPEIADRVSTIANTPSEIGFLRAATMHDFTYMGAIVSLFAALWTVRRYKNQMT